MRAIWQDIEEFRAATTPKDKRIAAAKTTRDVGIFWLDIETGEVFYGTEDQEQETNRLIESVASLIEDLGGVVPSYSTAEVGAGGEILKMLLPILLKILADRFTQND